METIRMTSSNGSCDKGHGSRIRQGFGSHMTFLCGALLFFILSTGESLAQGVGISESSITPDANAILELRSTLRGFLAPRLTNAERATLGGKPPAQGMLVYDTEDKRFYYWDNGVWNAVATGTAAGTVTSFSAGTLSPLFTTSVANPTTTPALSFSLSNAAAYTLLGNNTGGSAAPAYFSPTLASALFANQGTAAQVLHGNAAGNPSWGAVSLTADVSNTLPIANGGTNSSTALSGSSIMISNGTGVVQGAAGTTTQVLHGNASGAPSYGQIVNADITNGTIDLTTKVTGTLPVAKGGTGQSSALVAGGVLYGASTTAAAVTAAGTAASNQFLTSNGSSAPTWSPVGGTLIGIQKITSGTTYTPTAGTKAIILEMVGGGGGGGGASCSNTAKSGSAGGGGGAGGYLRKYITFTTLAASYTVAIGSLGSGGNSAAGGNGTATTFATDANAIPASTTFTANGGSGGAYLNSNGLKIACLGGAGGTATNGDVNVSGAPGGYGVARGTEYIVSGQGGSGIFGGGANSVIDVTSTLLSQNGNAAAGFGAGGGGATAQSIGTGAASATGGNGTAGLIFIYEFR